MAFPVASGQPNLSGIFIPEIWSGRLLEEFYKGTVFNAIANTNWENEIKDMGDTVHIRTVPHHTIHDYTKGQSLEIDTLTSPLVDLLIDKGKYGSFLVEGVDKVQSDMNLMSDWAEGLAKDMNVAVDREILAYIPGQVSTTNKGTTAGASSNYNLGTTGSIVQMTTSNLLTKLTQLGTVLDESDVPPENRWVVIPPWFSNAILNSDLKNASFSGTDKSTLIKQGLIGEIAGFQLFKSNNLTSISDGGNTAWNIVAGHMSGLTFAAQITETRETEDAHVWGKIMQSMIVYGRKVVKDTSLAVLYCSDNTGN